MSLVQLKRYLERERQIFLFLQMKSAVRVGVIFNMVPSQPKLCLSFRQTWITQPTTVPTKESLYLQVLKILAVLSLKICKSRHQVNPGNSLKGFQLIFKFRRKAKKLLIVFYKDIFHNYTVDKKFSKLKSTKCSLSRRQKSFVGHWIGATLLVTEHPK